MPLPACVALLASCCCRDLPRTELGFLFTWITNYSVVVDGKVERAPLLHHKIPRTDNGHCRVLLESLGVAAGRAPQLVTSLLLARHAQCSACCAGGDVHGAAARSELNRALIRRSIESVPTCQDYKPS